MRTCNLAIAALLVFAVGCRSNDAHAASAPFRLEVVARGLGRAVGMGVAPGDPAKRIFVVDKEGFIRIVREGRTLEAPFLDVSAKVSGGGEQGLLGLAFHPKFAENRRFFVNYTDLEGDTRVVEYRARADAPDRAEPQPVRELLFLDQPYSNHNGGHLLFGPDGLLYVGTGDGGSGNDPLGNAQNDASLLGKMLVLDVDAPKPAPKIVAKGLRNPWRYAFDAKTRDLYIADVGQNRWEWVHVVPAGTLQGLNFGWNVLEGSHCLKDGCNPAGLEKPEAEYPHGEGCSITGGFVYRGKEIPAIAGHYFYSDFCSGLLRSFRWEAGKVLERRDWKASVDPRNELSQVTSFGEDAAHELYVVTIDGTLRRFAPAR